MEGYKHGTYGQFADSIVTATSNTDTVAVYVGAAPVNLVRGYASKGLINTPVRLRDITDAREKMGYIADWSTFSLCEAFAAHFDNQLGNIGPIVVINVLDPVKHKKSSQTTTQLTFTNGRATIQSDTIVLDTLVLADKVEDEDFTVDYDYDTKTVIIESIDDGVSGQVQATYDEIDPAALLATDIIGSKTENGAYTGLAAVALVYQQLNLIPNLIVAPGWSEQPTVYAAMIKAASKINGHWDAMVYADIPVHDSTAVDTIALAIKWKEDNGYTSEASKVFWPQMQCVNGNNYHLSTIGAWRTMLVDASHDGIPMETPSNKAVPARCQAFGSSTNLGFDQSEANTLNENGITTVVFWGGRWVLWGPHTAAYKYGDVKDKRVVFDNNIRMMMYISNSFQLEHAATIDQPMTRAVADTIRNREQEKLDALVSIGALIGTPTVEYRDSDNSTSEIMEGNFVWNMQATQTPPFKSGTLRVAYSDAGFEAYYGEE